MLVTSRLGRQTVTRRGGAGSAGTQAMMHAVCRTARRRVDVLINIHLQPAVYTVGATAANQREKKLICHRKAIYACMITH